MILKNTSSKEVNTYTKIVPSHSHPHCSTHRTYSTAHRKITVYESSFKKKKKGRISHRFLFTTNFPPGNPPSAVTKQVPSIFFFKKACDGQLRFQLRHHFLNCNKSNLTSKWTFFFFKPCYLLFVTRSLFISIND